MERSQILATHNVKPRFVQQVMKEQVVRGVHITAKEAQQKPKFENTYLIEYCCGESSLLMKHWVRKGAADSE